jgi:hypothetical protein
MHWNVQFDWLYEECNPPKFKPTPSIAQKRIQLGQLGPFHSSWTWNETRTANYLQGSPRQHTLGGFGPSQATIQSDGTRRTRGCYSERQTIATQHADYSSGSRAASRVYSLMRCALAAARQTSWTGVQILYGNVNRWTLCALAKQRKSCRPFDFILSETATIVCLSKKATPSMLQ